MKYKEGQIVSVRVEGLNVTGIIKERKNTGEYIVQFDGGAEKLLPERLIKPNDSNMSVNEILNSPSRRSPSRRSPARAASPSRRAKGKSPSPSRRKSPSRKSNSRILKVSLENIHGKENSPSNLSFPRRRKPIEHTEELSTFHSVTETFSKVVTVNNGFSASTFSEGTIHPDKEEEKIVHLKPANYSLEDLSNFSDSEVIETTTDVVDQISRRSEPKQPVFPPREFGGWFGALLLMILMPAFVLGMHVFCNKVFCSYIQLPDVQQYKFFSTFFDLQAVYLYSGYIVLIALLNKIPFGGKKVPSLPGNYKKQIYCMNGLFSIFVVHAVIVALEYYNVPIVNLLYKKYFQLLCTAIVFGFSLAILVYFKSKFVPLSHLNSHGFTNNAVYDFFVGREVHPKLLGIDIKMLLYRNSLISIMVINSILIFKSLNVTVLTDNMWSFDKITYDPALLVSSILQIFYIFDKFIFESVMASTYELQSEGVGYLVCMMYSLYPFMLTAITKYFYEHKVTVCPWLLLSTCIVFFIGYVLFRGANSQKHAFRRNPYAPELAYLETMSTSQGKKLLVSGYWGLVRHPNYIGDILMHLAIGALCFTSPSGLGAVPSTILLIHRASRIDARCKRRYGSYWDKYCQKVKYQLIPKIY